MTPLLFSMLTLVILGGLGAYALYQARTSDVPSALITASRALVILVLGAIALVVSDPADVPALMRTALSGLVG
ncbi:hypothetical protein [Streptomyces halstedii]|uniref:hypothetical protein n=1 Tax=Streptomyces halstedii TaxID=1944 RepID=UPI003652D384